MHNHLVCLQSAQRSYRLITRPARRCVQQQTVVRTKTPGTYGHACCAAGRNHTGDLHRGPAGLTTSTFSSGCVMGSPHDNCHSGSTLEDAATDAGPHHIPRRRRSARDPHQERETEAYSRIRSRGLPRQAALAPGVKRTGEAAQVLIARQLKDLMKNPIPGIEVEPDENNAMIWHVQMSGPEGSPYEGGKFRLELHFSDDFPGKQPYASFVTRIWHPNVDFEIYSDDEGWSSDADVVTRAQGDVATSTNGNLCVEGLGEVCITLGTDDYCSNEDSSVGRYKVRSAACVLIGIQMLLSTPNADSWLNEDAALQLQDDPEEFEYHAREWTQMYASDHKQQAGE